ncbi:hypothetical protein NHX12_013546 [Muraenolepis orangiensis]|uniref:Uncharacterized protein n=1 Tax=Muraenolepis orangiensis TaxID=630683 RepID=A0A9Q0I860_9TELE|nr:hypothetical protein NHX12_013546 [Muraenolepis orangiensis]
MLGTWDADRRKEDVVTQLPADDGVSDAALPASPSLGRKFLQRATRHQARHRLKVMGQTGLSNSTFGPGVWWTTCLFHTHHNIAIGTEMPRLLR